MRKVEEVLRLKWGSGRSVREIARALGIGRTTVSEYLDRAEAVGTTIRSDFRGLKSDRRGLFPDLLTIESLFLDLQTAGSEPAAGYFQIC